MSSKKSPARNKIPARKAEKRTALTAPPAVAPPAQITAPPPVKPVGAKPAARKKPGAQKLPAKTEPLAAAAVPASLRKPAVEIPAALKPVPGRTGKAKAAKSKNPRAKAAKTLSTQLRAPVIPSEPQALPPRAPAAPSAEPVSIASQSARPGSTKPSTPTAPVTKMKRPASSKSPAPKPAEPAPKPAEAKPTTAAPVATKPAAPTAPSKPAPAAPAKAPASAPAVAQSAPVKPAATTPAKATPTPTAVLPTVKSAPPAVAASKSPTPVAPSKAPVAAPVVTPSAPAKPVLAKPAPTPAKAAPSPVATQPTVKSVAPAVAAKPVAPAPTPTASVAAKPLLAEPAKLSPAPAPVSAIETPAPAPKRKRAVKAKAAPEPAPTVETKPAPVTPAPVVAEASTTATVKAPRKRALKAKAKAVIPPILLEGDETPVPTASGPGQRYSLGPAAPSPTPSGEEPGELPEAYGTGRLLLTARDPHWLYAHWDLTREQQKEYNQLSADGHLILHVYEEQVGDEPVAVVHVHPESRHWFVHVGRGGVKYLATLGYRGFAGQWTTVATSSATLTPPDSLSDDVSVQFATLPVALPLPKLAALIKELALENVPLVQAIEELREAGHVELPSAAVFDTHAWTPEQERALMQVINMDTVRRVWIGSLEITELIRRKLVGELSSQAAAGLAAASSPTVPFGVSSVSSPFGGAEQKAKGFWFNVNAELIIYGATEPDAKVTIGGREIKLRRDGSFSYRFALPDGQYPLPAVATSADGTDTRWADLHFARSTSYGGEVGTHPQDAALRPPKPESL